MEVKELTLDLVIEFIKVIAIIVGGAWAIVTYRKSNRIKAAEILNTTETNFSKHIPILLDIEYWPSYKNIQLAIKNVKGNCTSSKDDAIIEKLDSMFRHFHTCYYIKKLKVDGGVFTDCYHYYLGLFIALGREELRDYIESYWPTVYNWSMEQRILNRNSTMREQSLADVY